MSKTNPRLIDIDEYVEWYNNFYKNSPSQCIVNREAIYAYWNLFADHNKTENKENPVSDED